MTEKKHDFLSLFWRCTQLNQAIIGILLGPMQNEAAQLLKEGFVAPDPISFEHPKRVFENVKTMSTGFSVPVEYTQKSVELRLDYVCAFASAIHGFASEYDLSWSNTWNTLLQGEALATCQEAQDILNKWNSGSKPQLLTQFIAQCKHDHDEWVYNR